MIIDINQLSLRLSAQARFIRYPRPLWRFRPHLLLLSIGLVAGLAGSAAVAGSPPVTVVPGQFSVSATGAATYTIPIAVPPDTASMVPALSLDYSSQSGDGIVGFGWTLSGLPSIDRCPRTYAQENIHGGVNYDNNDRYCMEGQRLVAISGSYGANGTEYRTEIDGFSKIISYGTAGNGPAYFKVWTKAGQIMEFGNTADSRILAVGTSTARSWAANKISDTKGNYLTVTYTNDTTNGQAYPTRIDYTGNANAGLSTYNSVQFTYNASRPDVTPIYQAGSLQQTTVLLTHVKTYQGSNVVYDYQLAYRLGSSTTHSRLTSVALCDVNGSCLAPTTFGWQGGTGSVSVTTAANGIVQGYGRFPGDFNGDGLTDFLANYGSTCPQGPIFLGQQDGTFVAHSDTITYNGVSPQPFCLGNVGSATILDFNGDGWADISTTGYFNGVPRSRTIVNLHTSYNQVGNPSPVNTVSGDFNGDGRSDYSTTDSISIGNGDGTFQTSSTTLDPSQAADFDGDGCSDFLEQGGTNAIVYNCNPAISQVNVPDWSGSQVIIGDFNGDGKSDILVVNSAGATLYLSTGTGLATPISIANSSTWNNYTVITGDWNGDGKTDIALISHTSGQPHLIFLSTGTGFGQVASIANSDTNVSAVVADWNNDGADDFWIEKPSGDMLCTFSFAPELITSISNGIGSTITVTYDRLNKNGSFYTKGSGATYPIQDADGPLYVLSRVDSSNGLGGNVTTTYSYAGYKRDLSGRGKLGFSRIAATDQQTGIVQTINYRTDFPYVGLVSSQTATSGSTTLKSVTNTYADTNEGAGTDGVVHHFVSLTQSVVAANDLDGSAFPTTTTNYTYDSYGNATQIAASVSDGSSRTTTNTFNNDTANWFIGELASSTIQSIVGTSNLTRTSCFQYDSGSGLLTREVIQPVSTTNCTYSSNGVQTDYTLDAYGHRTQATASGSNIATRSSTASYDALGEFQTGDCNALSQCETWAYDTRFGEPTSHTGPNGLTTSWSYDTFGRVTLETRPDGNKTATSYAYCSGVNGGSASCVTYGAYIATVTPQNTGGGQNGAQAIAYYDALSRGIAGDAQGFDGSWTRTATQYDTNGRVAQTSRPYFVSGGTAKWTIFVYDDLGRVTQTTQTNGRIDTDGYHGLTTSVTIDSGGKNQTTSTTFNAQGLNASVTDSASHTTSYVYDAFGDLTSVSDPSGNVITNTFDLRGNKTASSDPDMRSWSYGYDVLGELTSQTDAKSQATTLSYDVLGHVTGRTESALVSAWIYGTTGAGHNVGKLVEAKACTSSGCSTVVSDRTVTYDSLGRPSTVALSTSGSNYTYTEGYDANGRLSAVAYPSGFTAQYAYTSLGYLSQIKDNGSGSTYWTANSRDAELHLLSQTFGNGVSQTDTFDANTGFLTNVRAGPSNSVAQFDYTYDTLGNLTYRADDYQGTFEYACYDSLNRLTQYAAGNGVTACTSSQNNKTVAYDALGNVTSKTGVGTYAYPAAGQAHPHAVSGITGTVNGVVNPSYTYDANGNMTAGAGRTVAYTSFNMAASIVQGSTTVSLTYDSEHQRVSMTAPSGTTTYINDPASGALEEKLVSGSTTTWHDYLHADGRIVAEKFSGGTSAVRYFVGDHLGSTAVVTNESGSVVERDAYDPWGKRRNLDGSDDTTCSLSSLTTRGFTGHEHIDSECLINANARIYDQTIARFITADSIVPDPFDGQSFNRFAYVLNNPLRYADPSGHSCGDPLWECVDAWGRRLVQVLSAVGPGSAGGPGGTWGLPGVLPETVVVTGQREKPKRINTVPAPFPPWYGPNRGYGQCLSNVRDFVNAHSYDAGVLANELGNGTTSAEVLATAGNETHWGGGLAQYGNYFGLHGNGPAGTYYTTGNHTATQMFSGPDTFMSSGQVFVNNISPYLSPGMGQNPLGFFSILNAHGYATGNSGYPAFMVQNGRTRGPYSLVMACMAGG